MINSLDEAIKHCEEVADGLEEEAQDLEYSKLDWKHEANQCIERAKEHRQLAEWLKELKQRRDYENGCQYCKYKFRSDEDEPCVICSHNYTDKFKDDGTREVKADDKSRD